jgi:general secretion pathway protein G
MVMRRAGFTLIELLVSLAIIALLLSLVGPRYFPNVTKAEETTLRHNLATLRDAIDKHYADNGKYPGSLAELVQKNYIRALPLDPITQSSTTWVLIPPEDPRKGAIFNVKSGAQGNARDGTPYSEW